MGDSGAASEKQPVLHWMRDPVNVDDTDEWSLSTVPFLDPRLEQALNKKGFKSLLPVQVAVWIETIGPGDFARDICVNSPTGSGKTLAYALPIVQKLSTRKIRCLRALIVLPTRDLAVQVKEVFSAIASAVGLRVGLAVGQSSFEDEISDIIKNPEFEMGMFLDPEDPRLGPQSAVDILVATPGRLMDHINMTKGFTLEHLQYLVVDEADRLLREAYQSWLPTVIELIQSSKQVILSQCEWSFPTLSSLHTLRRSACFGFRDISYSRVAKMIFSATLTQDPSKLSLLDLHHPLFMTTGNRRYKLPEKLESYKLICDTKLKPLYLAALLQDLKGEKTIVFTSSIESTHRLSTLLNFFDGLPFKINEYSRLQRQSVRSNTLTSFREGMIDVLISSDAMTRGMDVEGVKNVVNYDMPPYIKTYIHRAGRTARAGHAGRCFTLLRKHEVKPFKKLLGKAGVETCGVHPLPPESVECLQAVYITALEKLEQFVASEEWKKSQVLNRQRKKRKHQEQPK